MYAVCSITKPEASAVKAKCGCLSSVANSTGIFRALGKSCTELHVAPTLVSLPQHGAAVVFRWYASWTGLQPTGRF